MLGKQSDDVSYIRNGLIIASSFILLLAPHFSWYFCWLILFLCFIPAISVFYLTAASFLLYLTWINDTPDRVVLLKTLIFAPFVLLAIFEIWLTRKGKVQVE